MLEEGNALSRNPNICASCSSMADGMAESTVPESASLASDRTEAVTRDRLEQKTVEPVVHHVPV